MQLDTFYLFVVWWFIASCGHQSIDDGLKHMVNVCSSSSSFIRIFFYARNLQTGFYLLMEFFYFTLRNFWPFFLYFTYFTSVVLNSATTKTIMQEETEKEGKNLQYIIDVHNKAKKKSLSKIKKNCLSQTWYYTALP